VVKRVLLLGGMATLGIVTLGIAAESQAPQLEAARREVLRKTMEAGNFKEAYDGYRELALARDADPLKVGDSLNQAIACLQRLNRMNEIDPFREAVIAAHPQNWRLLLAAAQSYMNVEHF